MDALSKVGIVVQRFGPEINGGAEAHAWQLAHQLSKYYEIHILTSCALDHKHWDSHYPPGEHIVDGLKVIRFPHPRKNRRRVPHLPLRTRVRFLLRRLLARLHVPLVPLPTNSDDASFRRWSIAQGPYMPDLIEHLQAKQSEYTALIFFTALFHPTAGGIQVASRRSILVPTLHDEKAMYRPTYHTIFGRAAWIMFNTQAEQDLAIRLYGSSLGPGQICGIGVDLEIVAGTQSDASQALIGVDTPYFVYVGRIDPLKGCAELFDYFRKARSRLPGNTKLVVIGSANMPLPADDCFVFTGFIAEEQKRALVAGARALIVPSAYESLSMVLLESLALNTPVLVNGASEVLKEHVSASRAGYAYTSFEEFLQHLMHILSLTSRQKAELAARGSRYVKANYSWQSVIDKYRLAIDRLGVANNSRDS